jgi:hypothetical protein
MNYGSSPVSTQTVRTAEPSLALSQSGHNKYTTPARVSATPTKQAEH